MLLIKKEIDIHQKLNHPGIVEFLGYIVSDDCIGIIIELVEGPNVFEYLIK